MIIYKRHRFLAISAKVGHYYMKPYVAKHECYAYH